MNLCNKMGDTEKIKEEVITNIFYDLESKICKSSIKLPKRHHKKTGEVKLLRINYKAKNMYLNKLKLVVPPTVNLG